MGPRNQLSVSRWSLLWRAITGSREPTPLEVPREGQQLGAYLCLGAAEDNPDWDTYLKRRRFQVELVEAAGGAGLFGHIVLFNPIGSGIVAVVKNWWLGSFNGATNVLIGIRHRLSGLPAGAGPNVGVSPVDVRDFKTTALRVGLQAFTFADVTPGYAGVINDALNTNNLGAPHFGPAVLGPGDMLVADAATANVPLGVVFRGYERDLEAGEKGLNP